MFSVGFIGTGNMGGAIARGLAKSGLVAPQKIGLFSEHGVSSRALAGEIGAAFYADVREMLKNCRIVVLAVKPVFVDATFRKCGDLLADRAVVSVVAGLTGGAMEKKLPAGARWIQTMPNTPAMVGEGATALCEENTLLPEERAFVEEMFRSVGVVLTVPERLINAVSALSGSGPAYAAMLIGALADGGCSCGLGRQQAIELAAQTLLGTAKMALETGKHPEVLKDAVCSPGGSTIAGVRALEHGGFRAAAIEAVLAGYDRIEEMRREAEKKA